METKVKTELNVFSIHWEKIVNYIKNSTSKIATNMYLYKRWPLDYTDIVESRISVSQFLLQEIRPELSPNLEYIFNWTLLENCLSEANPFLPAVQNNALMLLQTEAKVFWFLSASAALPDCRTHIHNFK